MQVVVDTIRTLGNETASLTVDLYGGAITDFHLKDDAVNPLTFAFSKEEMPENNRAGAPYQGHFLCLGRWGPPSAGEIKSGMPHHGQAANISWEVMPQGPKGIPVEGRLPAEPALAGRGGSSLDMQANCPLEELKVSRTLQMDSRNPVYAADERVTNTGALGRLYNMVQHPTLGHPFLDHATIVDCNATEGFNQLEHDHPEKEALRWPYGKHPAAVPAALNLRTPDKPYHSVFSFIVDKRDEYGWISAYAPRYQLLLGYIWRRRDYPWIHVWQDWKGDRIRYRGLEFGTAGLHQPFGGIVNSGRLGLFGEKTAAWIDAGETTGRRYLSFLFKTDGPVQGVRKIAVKDGGARIKIEHGEQEAHLDTIFKDFL